MTNYAHGHHAERVAAEYLKKIGYKVLAINWRVVRAEIDIIAQKKRGPIVFYEVKYRESNTQGDGLDYITAKKLEQMQFAAEIWVSENKYGGEYCLGAIEVTGLDYAITQCIEDVS